MNNVVERTPAKIYYGWYIVAVAFVSHFMSLGTSFYVFNALMEPLCEVHGWTRTDINIAIAVGSLFGSFAQLAYGSLVMRWGCRSIMVIGAILSGPAFIMLGRVQTFSNFCLFYLIVSVGNAAYGGIVANTVVNNWFVRKRGRALGLATAGQSLSGAVLPFAAMFIILQNGMARACSWIGISIVACGLVAFLVVRDWPEGYGLSVDGVEGESITGRPDDSTSHVVYPGRAGAGLTQGGLAAPIYTAWPLYSLTASQAFWKVGMVFALIMTGTSGVMAQLKPRFADVGFDDLTAMGLMASTALAGAVGKYLWGRLCDFFDSKYVVSFLAGSNALGLSLMLFPMNILTVIMFIIIFGFAMGGVMSTYPIIIGELFGRRSFPAVQRYTTMLLVLGLSGHFIAGQSYDRLGSYDTAYAIFILLDLLAIPLVLSIRRPKEYAKGMDI